MCSKVTDEGNKGAITQVQDDGHQVHLGLSCLIELWDDSGASPGQNREEEGGRLE